MARYLISFDRGWMSFPDEDLPDVAAAAPAAVQEAQDAGVFVLGGGIGDDEQTTLVAEGCFVFADGLEPASTATVVDGRGEAPVFRPWLAMRTTAPSS